MKEPKKQTESALAIAAAISVFLCSPLAIVLGIAALVRISRSQGALRGKGLAIAAVAAPFVLAPLALLQAWPRVEMYQCRARQTQARGNLKALHVAESSFAMEHARFSTELDAIGFAPRGAPIQYRYSVLNATDDAFAAEARGFGEMEGDLWTIDQDNEPQNVRNGCAEGTVPAPAPISQDVYAACTKGGPTSASALDVERGLFIHARGHGPRARALADQALSAVQHDLAEAEPWRADLKPEEQAAARQLSDTIRRASDLVFQSNLNHRDDGAVELDVVRFFADARAAIVAHVGRSHATLTRGPDAIALTDPHPDVRRVGLDADVEVDLVALTAMLPGDALIFGGGATAERLRAVDAPDGGPPRDASGLASMALEAGAADEDGAAFAVLLQRSAPQATAGCDVHIRPLPQPIDAERAHVER